MPILALFLIFRQLIRATAYMKRFENLGPLAKGALWSCGVPLLQGSFRETASLMSYSLQKTSDLMIFAFLVSVARKPDKNF